jgi:hypothetical protein
MKAQKFHSEEMVQIYCIILLGDLTDLWYWKSGYRQICPGVAA